MEEEKKALFDAMKTSIKIGVSPTFGPIEPPITALFTMHIHRITKNPSRAVEVREEGNQLFRLNYHDSSAHGYIFRKYCHSIAVTEKNSELQAEAYGNRSALLFHLLNYEDCMVDIKRALKITKSSILKCRLLCRQVACLVALGSPEAEKTLEEAKLCMKRCKDKQAIAQCIEKAEKMITEGMNQPKHRKYFHKKVPQQNHDVDGVVQCSLRSVIMGVREAGSISNLKKELETIDKGYSLENLENHNAVLQNISFKSLYTLHSKSGAEEQFFSKLPDAALRLLVALAKYSEFFGRKFEFQEMENLALNKDAVFIGSLILRLMKISLAHQRLVANKSIYSAVNQVSEPDMSYLNRGYSISILSSYINHSCNPNVSRCFTQDNNVVIYALQPIKKGSQIFECYLDGIHMNSHCVKLEGSHNTFYETPKDVRQAALKEIYGFTCSCESCVDDWPPLRPVLKDLIKRKPDSYHKKLFKQPLEMQLFKSNKRIISLAENSENAEYTRKMISDLSQSIQDALNGGLPATSIITWELITTLKRVFDRLYGGRLDIPDDSELYEN
ncbi:hypothetical protein QAD02_009026 [Eretmocerus hayati]|uniref:Uncharacterized protein n=1 Tax=Eretmocerus hayati TaxID=131215 RepID=A0ACC2N8I1_9HYME|nr:hypothetical protein QAD02_009026 [Eretmocerus hayati]